MGMQLLIGVKSCHTHTQLDYISSNLTLKLMDELLTDNATIEVKCRKKKKTNKKLKVKTSRNYKTISN